MKVLLTLLLTATMLASSVSVSCAKEKTPAFTMGIEKAVILIEYTASNGAIMITPSPVCLEGMFEDILSLKKICWNADEWFYTLGYKAKLSGVVDEIIAPPDHGNC